MIQSIINMKNTKFELQTFDPKKLNKKDKGWIKTNNFTLEVERAIRKGISL